MKTNNPKQAAASILSRREHSSGELFNKLIKLGFDQETVEETIEWLQERNYIDNRRYCAAVIRSQTAKGYGKIRICRYLYTHCIDKELFEEVWEDMSNDDGSDQDTPCEMSPSLVKAIQKICKGNVLDSKEKQRITGALFRRGFSWDEIRTALHKIAELQEEALANECEYDSENNVNPWRML